MMAQQIELTPEHRATLQKIVGAGLAGHTFIADNAQGMNVWIEAKPASGVLTRIKSGRTLMNSQVQPLIEAGEVEKTYSGSKVILKRVQGK